MSSHRAGRPRLVTAALAAVAGIFAVTFAPAVQAQSQDTTGHNGWGIVYSSPRSRQAAHLATASPASSQTSGTTAGGSGGVNSAGASGGTNQGGAAPASNNSPASGAAAGWANGAAAPAVRAADPPAAPAPASAPASTGAGTASYNTSYTPTLSAQPSAPAPAPAYSAPAGRVPGVIYSSNGAVYPPPTTTARPSAPATTASATTPDAYNAGAAYPAAPNAPAPTYQTAPAPTYQAAPAGPPAAPPVAYQAAPTYRGDPAPGAPPVTAQAPTSYQASYPGAPAAPAPAAYPAPAPTYPAPAYAGANQYPGDHPTNLPPAGRTDASYDVDTNPPPGGAPTPVSSMPGPASGSSVHLDELMSLHEWEASGASHLKPQEIAVLEKWIERYRQQVADSVTRAFGAPHATGAGTGAVPPISRTADGTPKNAHAVTAIRSGSRYITLDDGSVWDVYPSDQTETATWQAGDLVQVRVAPVAYGEFDHELVNNQRTGPVRAKFMGYAARQ
jgi:hypothetical protein